MPSILIEIFEVITPLELKFVRIIVPTKYLDIVVQGIPWHIFIIETLTPWVICRCPEVHSQILRLGLRLDGVVCMVKMAHFDTINGK